MGYEIFSTSEPIVFSPLSPSLPPPPQPPPYSPVSSSSDIPFFPVFSNFSSLSFSRSLNNSNNNSNNSRKIASHQRRKNGNCSEKEKSCYKITAPFAMSEKEIGEIEERI